MAKERSDRSRARVSKRRRCSGGLVSDARDGPVTYGARHEGYEVFDRAGGNPAPVVTQVAWPWPQGDDCTVGVTRALTVTVSATDEDTLEDDLAYTGSVSDCSPDPFVGAVSDVAILDCDSDSLERRTGSVTVTDPDDNSDTVTFEFQPCESGSVCEGGDPCE